MAICELELLGLAFAGGGEPRAAAPVPAGAPYEHAGQAEDEEADNDAGGNVRRVQGAPVDGAAIFRAGAESGRHDESKTGWRRQRWRCDNEARPVGGGGISGGRAGRPPGGTRGSSRSYIELIRG